MQQAGGFGDGAAIGPQRDVKESLMAERNDRTEPQVLPLIDDMLGRRNFVKVETALGQRLGRDSRAGRIDQHELRARQSVHLLEHVRRDGKRRRQIRAGDATKLFLDMTLRTSGRPIGVQ